METDANILQRIGGYVRKERLLQNLSQTELAASAGMGRSTLSLLERGEPVMLPSLLQALRALGRLEMLEAFSDAPEISPIAMYKAEKKQRRRARKSGEGENLAAEPEW